jgi:hypothetical protein
VIRVDILERSVSEFVHPVLKSLILFRLFFFKFHLILSRR